MHLLACALLLPLPRRSWVAVHGSVWGPLEGLRGVSMASVVRFLRDAVGEQLRPAALNEYLDAMAAFPDAPPRRPNGEIDVRELPTEAIRVRRWADRAGPSAIDPEQVHSLRDAVPRMLRVSYEIEEPWQKYTEESVTTFGSNGVQRLAYFMEGVWRADERRHASVFKAAWLGVTGEKELVAHPHQWEAELHGERALRRHLFMRLVAELGASGAYVAVAANSRGPLSSTMLNVAGDEFRHLVVFWAACKWWFGDAAVLRLGRLAATVTSLAFIHQQGRGDMKRPGFQDVVLLGQVGAAMAMTLGLLLRWDGKLSATRLQDVFGERPRAV